MEWRIFERQTIHLKKYIAPYQVNPWTVLTCHAMKSHQSLIVNLSQPYRMVFCSEVYKNKAEFCQKKKGRESMKEEDRRKELWAGEHKEWGPQGEKVPIWGRSGKAWRWAQWRRSQRWWPPGGAAAPLTALGQAETQREKGSQNLKWASLPPSCPLTPRLFLKA